MDLSIIIVNWNTRDLLLQCLDSIHKAESRLSFEVIVVDNGSTDDSVNAVSERFPTVRTIVNDQNLGFARANNQGISVGTGRYVMLLNSDTIVLPGALDKLVEFADEHPEVGVVGPKLLNTDGSLQASWAGFPTFWSELIGRNPAQRQPFKGSQFAYEVDWVMGACMLVRAKAIANAGMMDEDYFFYSEETDWCYRIKKTGWKVIYLAATELYHLGGGSADRASLLQLALLYQSKILFFRKHYGRHHGTLLRFGLVLANSFGVARRILLPTWLTGKHSTTQRIIAQSKLVWCLIRDRYPVPNP